MAAGDFPPSPDGEGDLAPSPRGDSPLRPGASIEEIQARVAHLSRAGTEGPPPTGLPPSDGAPVAVAQPGQRSTFPMTPPPRRRRLFRLLGGGTGAIVALAFVAAKLGLKLFAVGVAAAALSGAFGNRYSQLPSAQRDAFEQRYDAIIGSSFDGLSDAERSARVNDLVSHGAARLDDASLVLWTQLDAKADAATDPATCAQIARGWFVKDVDQAKVRAAVSKSYQSLPIDDYARVVDLNLKAMETEKAGTAPVRSVADATIEPVLTALYAMMPSADNTTIDSLTSGKPVTDTAACSALRAVDAAAAKLSSAQFASWAVWISTP